MNALILGVIFYLRNPGRDSIDQKEHRMSGTDDKPIPGEPPQTPDLVKPEAAHWLWRPWYAKSWWTAAAIFWLIAFFGPNLSLNAEHINPIIQATTGILATLPAKRGSISMSGGSISGP